ncbi:MAG: hypothetical protein IID18_05100 [Nitrospinae bacterium]|nr:hypothetical protein [Nitrospinota bacterium]
MSDSSIIKYENSIISSETSSNSRPSTPSSKCDNDLVPYDWLDDEEKRLVTENYFNSNIDTNPVHSFKSPLVCLSLTVSLLYPERRDTYQAEESYFYKTEKNAVDLHFEEAFEENFFSPAKSDEIEEKWKLSSKISNVLFDLDRTYRECSVENWDGYDAKPLIREAYSEVVQFLHMLPFGMPLPEVSPEPTGEIGLEWRKGDKAILLLSFSGKKLITYAGVFGPKNRVHGVEDFEEGEYKIIYNYLKFFD